MGLERLYEKFIRSKKKNPEKKGFLTNLFATGNGSAVPLWFVLSLINVFLCPNLRMRGISTSSRTCYQFFLW